MPPKTKPTRLRDAIEDAGWHAREAAMTVEESVIWRSSDALRDLADRVIDSPVGEATTRARSVIERRVVWPLADLLRDQGEFARTSIATAGVALALAAATGGAMLGAQKESEPATTTVTATLTAATVESGYGTTLEGVRPTFASSRGGAQPVAVPAKPAPQSGPGRTAWEFARAFVRYEVGRADEVAEAFQRLATPALVKSLAESPPRLPSNAKVPEARVLNVVLGERGADKAEASVSLVRLDAVSELRLSLQRSKKEGWKVTEVRG